MAEPTKNPVTKKWEFVFDYYFKGKRKQIRRRGFNSKREANDSLQLLQREVHDDEYIKQNNKTIAEFMNYWLENIRVLECEATSYYNNTLYLKNHIAPRIGSTKLQELSAMQCQEFVKSLHDDGFARNTIDRVCTLVKLALDKAIEYKLVKENKMRNVTLPKKTKRQITVWTVDQINQFLNFTKERRYYCVYAIALLTGMRQGEILGLRWKDIDYEKKIISVRQTLTHYGKEIKDSTKTISGERNISISEQLIIVLKEQEQRYIEFKKNTMNINDMDLVIFNLKDGSTVFPSNLTKSYMKDVERSGLPHIRFHDLRHSHATMLIQQNINVKVISERLGHSKVGVTLDVYSHVLPSMQQEVAERLDNIISIN
ncbi:tyrosine-type recombinase/integrase [Paenibacillus solisilvae]|uniref:Tyrosine-type recombinase/integrase n=1 Tax=Paenibacillus solisilvae TaxID=2486751 RepID=A0ABW0VQ08_9BACL